MTKSVLPRVTVNINAAALIVGIQPQKILFVGQQVSEGTATELVLQSNIQNGNENTLFGAKSILANVIRHARKVNPVNQFDAIAVNDDASGVPAVGTITIAGTATSTGTLTIIVGSQSDFSVDVAVNIGDTPTIIGDAIVTAVDALINGVVDADNTAGVVTFTANNDGTIGNSIPLESKGAEDIAGVTTVVVTMAAGVNDPTLTTVFDAVGDSRYQAVVWCFPNNLTPLTSFLDPRFNVTNDVLDGMGFTANVDTFSTLTAAISTENSESLVFFGFKKETETEYAGPSLVEMPMFAASQFAAIRSLRFTVGESISNFVISNVGALDSIGGPALASKPYFNTPLSTFFTETNERGWTRTEITSLNTAGISIMGNNRGVTEYIVGEVLTTFKTNDSFKFLNFVDTSSTIREFFVNNLHNRYQQFRLTDGDLVAGHDQANENSLRATLIEFYNILSGTGFILTQAGEVARRFFIDNLSVSINLSNGSATITMQTPLVTQLREIIATMTIVFSPSS